MRIAVITVVGGILAALVGGSCAICAALVPVVYEEASSPDETLATPTTTLQSAETGEPLRAAKFQFEDWRTGNVFGVSSSVPITISISTPWEDKRALMNAIGYHVYYEEGDFATLDPRITPDDEYLRSGGLQGPPMVPIVIELWNLDREATAVIDEITLELVDYEPPRSAALSMYYVIGPGMGGGNGDLLPDWKFDTRISPSTTVANLLRRTTTRVPIDSLEALLVFVNVTFESTGRYFFNMEINYHWPDGSSGILRFEDIAYSWLEVDRLEGSALKVIE